MLLGVFKIVKGLSLTDDDNDDDVFASAKVRLLFVVRDVM